MRLFADVVTRVEDPFLRHALALAERGRGRTSPNPLVGCVVVADGLIVGEGYHPRAGEPHAEVFALADAGPAARGACAYITLEPCTHHGRTPPCVDALVSAGIARVVIGMADPTPEAGGGGEMLRRAGVDVAFAVDPSPFMELNAGWLKRLATGVPMVRVKAGLSIDGKSALSAGQRASITGESGAEVTRHLRDQADAVLVGAKTVMADDPQLTVRDSSGRSAEHQPLRVVLARTSLPAEDSRVLTDGLAPTLLLVPPALAEKAARIGPNVLLERYEPAYGLLGALRVLGERGINDLLVEAGPTLLGALWEQDLYDEIVVVTAGGVAGPQAPSAFAAQQDADGVALVRRARPVTTGIVGDVSIVVWRRREDA